MLLVFTGRIDFPSPTKELLIKMTGSGISEQGNYAADGWNSTYLRGIQPTDKDGVVVFDTIFPSNYSGRATHTHLLVHSNATLLPNGTLLVNTGSITHNGQLFFNEKLRSAVEAASPYNTNTIEVTSNAETCGLNSKLTLSTTLSLTTLTLAMTSRTVSLCGSRSVSTPLPTTSTTRTMLLLAISKKMAALRTLVLTALALALPNESLYMMNCSLQGLPLIDFWSLK